MTRSSTFSAAEAKRVTDLVACFKHTKGRWRGVPFVLTDWQRPDWERVFGTMVPNPDRQSRRKMIRQYRRWFKAVAKKNGKTEEAAAAAGVLLYGDDEYGAEVYSAAASRDQATLVYRELSSMVKQIPSLAKMTKFYDSTKRLYVPSTESTFQALSADADYSDGINPSGVVVDELHRHKNRDLYDLLRQGSGTREQPLTVIITTAGSDKASVCFEEWEYARKVRDGVVDDPSLWATIYEVPAEVTFEEIAADESLWPLANPALGDFLDIEDLRAAVREAREKPAMQNSVRRLRFNQWTSAESRWFDLGAWDACGRDLITDIEKRNEGRRCYGGLDLASTGDLAAWVLQFPRDDAGYDSLFRCYLPQAALEKRTKHAPAFAGWAAAGFLKVTPGDVIDYDYIKADVLADAARYQIAEIGYDPWNATQVALQLQAEGLTVTAVRQGFATLSPPSKLFETLVARGEIHHGGHPVARWCADNVQVETDAQLNIKPSKKYSTEKIDLIAAAVTALERGMHAEEPVAVSFTAFD